MIAIIDYGMGNLRSVENALAKLGYEAQVTSDPRQVMQAAGVILPGVGAFGDAMFNLRQGGMMEAIRQVARKGTPFLGICLGMQLLFSTSEEHGHHIGLNLIPGHVRKFRGSFKIPHMGWNRLQVLKSHPVLEGVRTGDYVYFVHSYYAEPLDRDVLLAVADYHGTVPAVVGKDNILGMQFHPEKSSAAGLKMLANFASLCQEGDHKA
jgi:glutamine amidotransferase